MKRPFKRTRVERLVRLVTTLTRLYRRRRDGGRRIDYLVARSNRLTRAYLAALEMERDCPI